MKKVKMIATLVVSDEFYENEFKHHVEDRSLDDRAEKALLDEEGIFTVSLVSKLLEEGETIDLDLSTEENGS